MRLRFAAVFTIGALLAACTRKHGPHITLDAPSAPTPNFGDAPRAPSTRNMGGGGGGSGVQEFGGSGGGQDSPGKVVGVVAGAVAGGTALVVTAAEGKVTCVPGNDTPSDAGITNLCSGERREAAPDVGRAFSPR